MSDMTLKALLFGEDRTMSKTFKGAGKAAESTSKTIKGHLGGLAKAMHGDFTAVSDALVGGVSKLGPYGAAAGAIFGTILGAEAKLADASISAFKDVAGQTLALQRIMGGTAEDASRLRFAFQETGVDAEASARSIGILSKNVVAGAPGWKAMGINAKDATGHFKPMAELLPQIADHFAKMPNGAQKSAEALKLFGKGGLALLPFLNRGAKGLQELKDKSDKFGLTLSGKDLDALKKSRAAHKDWDAAIEGAKVRIGSVLLPMLTKLVTYFTVHLIPVIIAVGSWYKKHGDQIQKLASIMGQMTVAMIKYIINFAQQVWNGVVLIGKGFQWVWNSIIKPTITLILNGFALLATAIGKTLQALGHIPGFDWARKAGDMMLHAAAGARQLAKDLNALPTSKTVTVNTYFKTHGDTGKSAVGSGAGVKGYASGGSNIPAGWAMVGENGPEYMYVPGGSTILPHGVTPGRGRAGGGDVHVHIGTVMGDPRAVAQEIRKNLLAVKRQSGMALGLA
jgi:hypothetical protein